MRRSSMARLWAVSLLAVTASCGRPNQEGNAGSGSPNAAADWNAADACAMLDQALVAEAAGAQVKGTQLTNGAAAEGLATVSTCTYELGGNGTISVLVRKSPRSEFSTEAVERARTMGGAIPPAEDIAGLGRAALWSKPLSSLQVFVDDTRYVTIQVVMPRSARDPKAVATAIAAKLA